MNARTFVLPAFRQRWLVAALILCCVAWSIVYSQKVIKNTRASAVMRWGPQIVELEEGKDIYELYTYPNPPIMALLLSPIAHLPPLTGALVWFYLKVGMTVVSFVWLFRIIETPERPFPAWAKALTVALCLRTVLGDLSHGNVNLFIVFLIMAGLYAYHRGRDLEAGLLIGLSIACKVTPVLFLPYFVWKRAWKTLAGCSVGLVLFLLLVPGAYFGQVRNVELLGSWCRCMVLPWVVEGKVYYSELNNQSLPGLVTRLLTHSPSSSTYIDGIYYTPLEYHNLLDLDPAVARWIVKICMALFILLIAWSCRTPTMPRQGWRLPAECSLVLLGMLLFSERTWKHHCVTLMLPLAVLCYHLAWTTSLQRRRFLVGCLAAVFLLMTTTSSVKELDWSENLSELAQTYGAYVWAYLILLVGIAILLRRADPWPTRPVVLPSVTTWSGAPRLGDLTVRSEQSSGG